jgi:hypothetical protein
MSPSYSYRTILSAVEDILCLSPVDRVVAEYTHRVLGQACTNSGRQVVMAAKIFMAFRIIFLLY